MCLNTCTEQPLKVKIINTFEIKKKNYNIKNKLNIMLNDT